MSSWCQRSDKNRQTVWSRQDATVTQIITRYNQLCKRASLNGQLIGLKQMANRSRRPHQVKTGQQKGQLQKAYLLIMSIPFMTTVNLQDNVPCHKEIISQLPDLSQGDSLLDVVICILDMQQTIPQQLCDAIASIWARICEQCFQNLVGSLLQNA